MTNPVNDAALEVSATKSLGKFALDVSFTAPSGITVLFGASGSGKSTLLNCVSGLVRPDRGRILISGEIVFDSQAGVDAPVTRRRIGYLFQNLALFPHLTVEENIGYGLRDPRQRGRISEFISAFRLEHVRGRKPKSLSGGEQQRVALARALAPEPKALLLDEPLSALDPAIKAQIMDDLRRYLDQHAIPVLYVTHSREEVFAMGRRVVALDKGHITGQGIPRDVLSGHRHQSVAEWGSVENIFDGTITSLHEQQGTMTFRTGAIELEVPLGRAEIGGWVRVGVSAADILLATVQPMGLSARNQLRGRIVSMERRDHLVRVHIDCGGTPVQAHLTPGAIESLKLQPGSEVWVVIKTHSCFLIIS